MKHLLVIGIGAGNVDQVTMQAVRALNRVDVFFVLDKGEATQELVTLRQEILDRYVTGSDYRVVEGADPERDRTTTAYAAAVEDWRRRRADVCEVMVRDELTDGQVGAFLVWGDPSLYDSTLGIVDDLLARGVDLAHEVVPGVSSISALVARHRISLNRVGGAVQVTTGRRLREHGWPDGVEDVVVMLDPHCSFAALPADIEVFWGAYLGMPDELLLRGRIGDVADEIGRVRAAARERKGWVMDTYLLRRPLR